MAILGRPVVSRIFRTFDHAAAAPLRRSFISRSGSIFMCFRVLHCVPATCFNLAAARQRQD